MTGMAMFCLLTAGTLLADGARYALPSFISIGQGKLSEENRKLKELLNQGKISEFYAAALPEIKKGVFDQDGRLTEEALNNALFINHLVIKAPYQDYHLDHFTNMINEFDLKSKIKAYQNLGKIQKYARNNRKKIKQGDAIVTFCLETEFEYIREMTRHQLVVDAYIASLIPPGCELPVWRLGEILPYWRFQQKYKPVARDEKEAAFIRDLYRWNVDSLPRLQASLRWHIECREGALLNILLKWHRNNRSRILEKLKECGYRTDRELVEFFERNHRGMTSETKFLYTAGMLKEYKKFKKEESLKPVEESNE